MVGKCTSGEKRIILGYTYSIYIDIYQQSIKYIVYKICKMHMQYITAHLLCARFLFWEYSDKTGFVTSGSLNFRGVISRIGNTVNIKNI